MRYRHSSRVIGQHLFKLKKPRRAWLLLLTLVNVVLHLFNRSLCEEKDVENYRIIVILTRLKSYAYLDSQNWILRIRIQDLSMGSRVKKFLRNCNIFSLCPIELTLSQSRNEWIHLLVIGDIPVKILLTKIPRFRN